MRQLSCPEIAGYYNGFGGKVEPGESIAEAAEREVSPRPASPLCMPSACVLRGRLYGCGVGQSHDADR